MALASCQRGPIVREAIDGDTIILSDGTRVRYIGVDTPEKDRPYYQEATDFNRSMVAGRKIRLEYDIEKTDAYGRHLAYVYLKDGTFVNAELLKQGYAYVYTIPPNLKHTEQFVKFQRRAREEKAGLWGVPVDPESSYVFSARGRAFHRPSCEFAKKIGKRNRIQVADRGKAFDRGLAPCRKCRP
ncbi:MAG: thermonuclease family protein [Elusimicrobia bacterium]|nr:thermonuclease family protein [Elusimicrobiota bacterium]